MTLASVPAAGAERDYLLRWIQPDESNVAGYDLYLSLEPSLP